GATTTDACKIIQGMRNMDFQTEEVQYLLYVIITILESSTVPADMHEQFFRYLKHMRPAACTQAYCAALAHQLEKAQSRTPARTICRWISNIRFFLGESAAGD